MAVKRRWLPARILATQPWLGVPAHIQPHLQNEWTSYYEEMVYVLEEIEHMIKKLPEWAADEPVEKTPQTQQDEPYIHSEPLGVVLIIGAWNYPFNLIVQPMVGAIAAGTVGSIPGGALGLETSLTGLLQEAAGNKPSSQASWYLKPAR